MGRRPLTLALWDYDRTRALADGSVRPEGLDLVYLPLEPEETFWRMLRHQEFDAAEMSFASYLVAYERGAPPLVAIPVFPSRAFRHNGIFVHAGSGIERPEDLRGRRVGIPEWQLTAVVWVRGILQEEYGVGLEDVEWWIGGEQQAGREEKLPLQLPTELRIRHTSGGQTLDGLLEAGEIDALIAPRMPASFRRGSPKVRRLFPDYQAVEADYFRRTRIFPIMHTVVLRRDVYERDPWIAQSLYKAFEEARRRHYERLYETVALRVGLPWLVAHLEETRAVMGEDFWPYGVEANRKALTTLIRYAREQYLIAREPAVEELFAPNTLDAFKV